MTVTKNQPFTEASNRCHQMCLIGWNTYYPLSCTLISQDNEWCCSLLPETCPWQSLEHASGSRERRSPLLEMSPGHCQGCMSGNREPQLSLLPVMHTEDPSDVPLVVGKPGRCSRGSRSLILHGNSWVGQNLNSDSTCPGWLENEGTFWLSMLSHSKANTCPLQ